MVFVFGCGDVGRGITNIVSFLCFFFFSVSFVLILHFSVGGGAKYQTMQKNRRDESL